MEKGTHAKPQEPGREAESPPAAARVLDTKAPEEKEPATVLRERIAKRVSDEMPNVEAVVKDETLAIHTQHIIPSYEIGAREAGQTLDSASPQEEAPVGKEVIRRLSVLIREMIAPPQENHGQDALGYRRSEYLTGTRPSELVKANSEIAQRLERQPYTGYNNFQTTFDDKGVPLKLAETITLAVSSGYHRIVSSECKRLAEEIESEEFGETDTKLQSEKAKFEQEASQLAQEIAAVESELSKITPQYQEASTELVPLENARDIVVQDLDRLVTVQDLRSQITQVLPTIEVRGRIMKKYKFHEDWSALDRILDNSFVNRSQDQSDDLQQSLTLLGLSEENAYRKNIEAAIAQELFNIATQVESSAETQPVSIDDLLHDLSTVISQLTGDRDLAFREVKALTDALSSRSSADNARDHSLTLLRKLTLAYFLTRRQRPDIEATFFRTSFFRELNVRMNNMVTNQLNTLWTLDEAYRKHGPAVESYHSTSARLGELILNQEQATDELAQIEEEKARLQGQRERRQKEIYGELILPFIQPQYQGWDRIKEPPRSWEELSTIMNTQEVTDLVDATIEGLPHLISDKDRNQVIENIKNTEVIKITPHTEAAALNLPNFGAEVVAALLPEDHPTPETAATIISRALAAHSRSFKVRVLAGHKPKQKREDDPVTKRIVDVVVHAILERNAPVVDVLAIDPDARLKWRSDTREFTEPDRTEAQQAQEKALSAISQSPLSADREVVLIPAAGLYGTRTYPMSKFLPQGRLRDPLPKRGDLMVKNQAEERWGKGLSDKERTRLWLTYAGLTYSFDDGSETVYAMFHDDLDLMNI